MSYISKLIYNEPLSLIKSNKQKEKQLIKTSTESEKNKIKTHKSAKSFFISFY